MTDYFAAAMVRNLTDDTIWIPRPCAWYSGTLDVESLEMSESVKHIPARLVHVTDGLSHTVLVAEQADLPNRHSWMAEGPDPQDAKLYTLPCATWVTGGTMLGKWAFHWQRSGV